MPDLFICLIHDSIFQKSHRCHIWGSAPPPKSVIWNRTVFATTKWVSIWILPQPSVQLESWRPIQIVAEKFILSGMAGVTLSSLGHRSPLSNLACIFVILACRFIWGPLRFSKSSFCVQGTMLLLWQPVPSLHTCIHSVFFLLLPLTCQILCYGLGLQ